MIDADALPDTGGSKPPAEFDPSKPTAVLLVYPTEGRDPLDAQYPEVLPGYFHNLVFVSVGVLYSGTSRARRGFRADAEVEGASSATWTSPSSALAGALR